MTSRSLCDSIKVSIVSNPISVFATLSFLSEGIFPRARKLVSVNWVPATFSSASSVNFNNTGNELSVTYVALRFKNFSFVEHNFKDIRTSALSCVYMVTSLPLWFVRIKGTCTIPLFLFGSENYIEMLNTSNINT